MVRASAGVAGRGPAKQRTTLRRCVIGLGHDVSILIAADGGAGRQRGVVPRQAGGSAGAVEPAEWPFHPLQVGQSPVDN
jgi:hypothetical protein